jgi:transformation/transcription domain-associated protein
MEAVKKNLMNEAIARERMAAAAAAQNGGDQMDVDHNGANPQPQSTPNPNDVRNHHVRQAAEYVDEIVTILKTAFPLLILSLETMVDHINARFKATTDEEIYRLVCMLLQDATQVRSLLEKSHKYDTNSF